MAKVVYILSRQPWWDQRHIHKEVPALASAGFDVTFVAEEAAAETARELNIGFVGLTPLQKRFCALTGGVNLLPLVRRIKPDVCHICSFELLPIGLLLELTTGIRCIYDCHEDMANAMMHKQRFPLPVRRLLKVGVGVMQVMVNRMFTGLIASDPGILRIHRAMPANRMAVFYNVPKLTSFTNDYEPLKQRPYDLTLMGSMSRTSGIVIFIQALGLLKQKGRSFRTLLIGKPDEFVAPEISRMTVEYGLVGDIDVTGVVPYSEIPQLVRQARIGVIALPDLPKFRNNISMKMFEYAASGMPTISPDLPPERIFIEHNVNGLLFPPGDAQRLADAIETLVSDPALAERMGRKGRELVERKWNCETNVQDVIRLYHRVLGDDEKTAY